MDSLSRNPADEPLANQQLARARMLLAQPRPLRPAWPALAAAFLFASAATLFAVVMILAPTPV